MNKHLKGFAVIIIALITGLLLSCSDDNNTSASDEPLTITITYYSESGPDGEWITSDDIALFRAEVGYYSKNIFLYLTDIENRVLIDTLGVLIIQPWNWVIKSNMRSDDIGADGQWFTSDDTYFSISDSERDGDVINYYVYNPSNYPSLNITDKVVYTLSGNQLIKILNYGGTGADGIWDTDDDNTSSGSSYLYYWDSSSRIERIREYSGDEAVFEYAVVVSYDTQGRADTVKRYSDIDETAMVNGYDLEYSDDGNTIEMWAKDAAWATTGRRTYEYISAEETRITYYTDAGPDSNWGTYDDTLVSIMKRTFSDGMPDGFALYQPDGTMFYYVSYTY